jgi:transaldolase
VATRRDARYKRANGNAAMQLFIDTADIAMLKELNITGLVDGVTTNPSIIAKAGKNFLTTIAEICEVISGPVSAEVAATDAATMIAEGKKLANIAPNVVVKVPLTWDGLQATREFSQQGIQTNVTLCFTPMQAMLAAKAGATFVSPFIGRLDDLGFDGMDLIHEIRAIYDTYSFDTEILAASIRSAPHVKAAALAGADCATIPPAVFKDLVNHPLTASGLQTFISDWAKTGQSIL